MIPRPPSRDVVVILNGISPYRKHFYHAFFPKLSALCRLEVFETKSPGEAIEFARQLVQKDPDALIAAGGDGTVNEVVNGMLSANKAAANLPALGIIPLGSGNDFARTLDVRRDPKQLAEILARFQTRCIDIGEVVCQNVQRNDSVRRYFVNVADAGMGPAVVQKVPPLRTRVGASAAYYLGILSTLVSYKPVEMRVESEDWVWTGDIRTIGVANGKYYGHGLCVAPDAKPDGGEFGVFLCGKVSAWDFIRHSRTLRKGQYVRLQKVSYKSATRVSLSSAAPCLMEVDGEVIGYLPAHVSILKNHLKLLV